MAVEFNFFLSDTDADRLFSLKAEAGADDLTGNEYARQLLEGVIRQMHPETVKYDDVTGERIPRKGTNA